MQWRRGDWRTVGSWQGIRANKKDESTNEKIVLDPIFTAIICNIKRQVLEQQSS